MSKRAVKTTHKYEMTEGMKACTSQKYFEANYARWEKPVLCPTNEIRSHRAHGRDRKFTFRHAPFDKRKVTLPSQ